MKSHTVIHTYTCDACGRSETSDRELNPLEWLELPLRKNISIADPLSCSRECAIVLFERYLDDTLAVLAA